MTYEKQALIEALKSVSAVDWEFTEEQFAAVAEGVVASLHEQHYRLISDGTSFDD